MRRLLANLLINRDYALFMAGSFISATGSWFLAVAVGWLIWEIGRSEFLLGVANFAQMGPLLVLGLYGGVLSDRLDRRRLILATQVVIAASTVVLAAVALTQLASVGLILALLLIMGISQALTWPSWSPFIADMVGPQLLRRAVALNSARFNLTRVIGPGLAGVLLAQVGAGICLAIGAASQLSLLLALSAIRASSPPRVAPTPWFAAVKEGLWQTWGTPSVRETMLVATVLGILIVPYTVFLPAYAANVLQMGPQGLGLLFTVVGIGAIGGAAVSGSHFVTARPRFWQGALALLSGVSLIVFALSVWPAVSLVALLFLGLGSIGYYATANATVQLAVPPSVVGRVMGVWVVVGFGTTPLGGLVLGGLAEQAGLGLALAGAGVLALLLSLALVRHPRQARPAAGEVKVPRSAK